MPATRSSNATGPGLAQPLELELGGHGSTEINSNSPSDASGSSRLTATSTATGMRSKRRAVQQPAHRRLIAPLHIIDGYQQRRLLGQIRCQPVQAVMNLQLRKPSRLPAGPQSSFGDGRWATEQRAALS